MWVIPSPVEHSKTERLQRTTPLASGALFMVTFPGDNSFVGRKEIMAPN